MRDSSAPAKSRLIRFCLVTYAEEDVSECERKIRTLTLTERSLTLSLSLSEKGEGTLLIGSSFIDRGLCFQKTRWH